MPAPDRAPDPELERRLGLTDVMSEAERFHQSELAGINGGTARDRPVALHSVRALARP